MLIIPSFGIALIIVSLVTIALCIVGNKTDLPKDLRKVPTEKGREYAKSLGALFAETSAARDVGKEKHTHACMCAHTRTHKHAHTYIAHTTNLYTIYGTTQTECHYMHKTWLCTTCF